MTASGWFMVDGREFETVEDRAENWQGARHIECGGEFRTVGRDAIEPCDHKCAMGHDPDDDFILCDKSGVCLASMHMAGCISQMSWAERDAIDCGNSCDGPSGHGEGCPIHCECFA